MDFLHDLALAALMLFVGFIVFDWGRIWWYARRHGVIRYGRHGSLGGELGPTVPWRWEQSYLGYKLWTWLIRVATWFISAWHLILGICWVLELILDLWP